MLEHLINYFSRDLFSYVGITIALFLTSVGLPIPEDIILLAAGFVTANGFAELELMIPVTIIAILLGDLMMYGLGYKFGDRIYNLKPFSYLFTQHRIEKIEKFYKHYGKSTIFIGRFMAGLRAWIYLFAGASKMALGYFILMDFLAALISVPLLVWLGFHFENEIKQVAFFVGRIKLWILIFVILGVVFIIIRKKIRKTQ
jgi:membrane protein DedA with SNARE-associated domain